MVLTPERTAQHLSNRSQGRSIMPNPEDVQRETDKVVHNAAEHRFEIDKNGQVSVLEYVFKKHRIFFKHTEVPLPLRGQGLGTQLAHAALEYTRRNGLVAVAVCPFVKKYVEGHPEYQSSVALRVVGKI
jgi:predicted GNAT family acetyltransferase